MCIQQQGAKLWLGPITLVQWSITVTILRARQQHLKLCFTSSPTPVQQLMQQPSQRLPMQLCQSLQSSLLV